MGIYIVIIVFISVCIMNDIRCSLSRKDVRRLTRKIEQVRSGLEHKLVTALSDIDEIRDKMWTCKCSERNTTVTDLIASEPNQSMLNEMNKMIVNSLLTSERRVMQAFLDEKVSRKNFENKMADRIQSLTKSPVHGDWTKWQPWGECSQTCGTGLMKRSRQCSNPYPGPYGNHCVGDYTDTKLCLLQECTQVVHGGWTKWQQWGECSQTCGTGLMKRSRQCSNPYPGPYGNHCFGDFTDTKLCLLQECTHVVHGGWADWQQWGECSQTCGTGLLKRSRHCSNPYPGPNGNHCFGDSTDTKLCLLQECTQDLVDGGWSDWTSYSTCTATCNGGLMTRDRRCNHPQPTSQGRYCDGRNMESQLCNTKNCPEPIVFFTVDEPQTSLVNNAVVFKDIETSSGNEYSTTTGQFTCRIPGLYHFFFKFNSRLKSGSDDNTYCAIFKNRVFIASAHNSVFGKSGSSKNRRSASASVYTSLVAGDTVHVGDCWGWDNIDKDGTFDFVGALITAS